MTSAATAPFLPPIETLTSLPPASHALILDTLFEPSPALHDLSLPLLARSSFPSYTDLVNAVGAQLVALRSSSAPSSADAAALDAILAAHPRLGEKRVDSAQSRAEQAALRSAPASDPDSAAGEADALRALNAEYEAAFPGLRYVVFVAGRGRAEILADMRARIERADAGREREEAIRAMCEIAADRAGKLQKGG